MHSAQNDLIFRDLSMVGALAPFDAGGAKLKTSGHLAGAEFSFSWRLGSRKGRRSTSGSNFGSITP